MIETQMICACGACGQQFVSENVRVAIERHRCQRPEPRECLFCGSRNASHYDWCERDRVAETSLRGGFDG